MAKKAQPQTLAQIKQYAAAFKSDIEEAQRLDRIEDEFRRAFDLLESLPKSVSIFGSTQAKPGSRNYEKARTLASRLVSDHQVAIVTGGGSGIMEAANRGAAEAGGISVGLRIDLTSEHTTNNYANKVLDFHYFFARKVALGYAASMYVFFPGGFGTMDEFFELLMLVQTNKIQRVPIFCIGASYWDPLVRFFDYYMLRHERMIEPDDLGLFTVTDDLDLVLECTKVCRVRH
ncbi:TIGR00730 family Rossman fold protein [Candidatus Saccharibacteria bacterium]|nr:TIGR00730 family Rossman fold protein [Candidatus Saccharibacteria bacterium]